jgi:dTDP-4-amino-4,6-dideoxygalactose transaminase
VFSLQGDKLVPAGEGGVLLTDDDDCHRRTLLLGDITRIIRMPPPDIRFAATSFGIKTRIAPMSAALGRAMLARLPETNRIRNRNHLRLIEALEPLGFECFRPGPGVERVFFEFLIRHRDPAVDIPRVIGRLRDAGCVVGQPRYPLLHQQPFFTEGHWLATGRYPRKPPHARNLCQPLPRTERANEAMIRLPNFCHPDAAPLIDQYAEAFRWAVG